MNRPNIHILIILLLIRASLSLGQQLPILQHSSIIRSAFNPAEILNDKNEASVYLLRGNQFSKFDGGFNNNYLSFTSPLKDENLGLGLELTSRSFGIINQLSAGITYGYRAKINLSTFFNFGVRLGFTEHRYNRHYLVIYQEDDNVINNIPMGNIIPNGNVGISFHSKIGIFEFSVPQLFSNGVLKLTTNSYQNIVLAPHLFARYSVNLGTDQKNFRVTPIISMRYLAKSIPQYEAGIMMWVKDKFWLNGNFRSGYSVSLGTGLKIKNTWTIGYSHDRPVNNIYNFYNSSHEIILGYSFVRENLKKNLRDSDRTQDNGPAKIKMDSISTKQELDIAREYLVLRLNQKQIEDSLDKIAEGRGNGGNYKNITVQLNLIDSILNILSMSDEKSLSSPSENENTNKRNSKPLNNSRLKEISEEKLLKEIYNGGKDEIKIIRNKQPELKEYVELTGEDCPKGYYLIIGVFSTLERAQKFRWQEGSENSKIIINKTNKYFYVVEMYSPTKSLNELEKYIRNIQSKNKPMWILDY